MNPDCLNVGEQFKFAMTTGTRNVDSGKNFFHCSYLKSLLLKNQQHSGTRKADSTKENYYIFFLLQTASLANTNQIIDQVKT